VELAEGAVVLGHGPLTLEDMNLDLSLIVRGGREDLTLSGRDRGVALDELGEHAAQGLDAQERAASRRATTDPDFTGQHPCLDGRSTATTSSGFTPL
jgi:hypothetical protein